MMVTRQARRKSHGVPRLIGGAYRPIAAHVQRRPRLTLKVGRKAGCKAGQIVQRSNVWLNRLADQPLCTLGPLLDRLVGGGQQRFRDGKVERLGGCFFHCGGLK
jgi:hypothetical protein